MTSTDISAAIIGMDVSSARTYLEQRGMILRIMSQDGQLKVGSCEMRSNRINVEIEQGKITNLLQVG